MLSYSELASAAVILVRMLFVALRSSVRSLCRMSPTVSLEFSSLLVKTFNRFLISCAIVFALSRPCSPVNAPPWLIELCKLYISTSFPYIVCSSFTKALAFVVENVLLLNRPARELPISPCLILNLSNTSVDSTASPSGTCFVVLSPVISLRNSSQTPGCTM